MTFFFLVKIIISKLVWFFPPSFRVVTWYPCMFWRRFSKASAMPRREADSRSSAAVLQSCHPVSDCGDGAWLHLTHNYASHGWWDHWWSQSWEHSCHPHRRVNQLWGISPRSDVLLKDLEMAQLSSHPVSLGALYQQPQLASWTMKKQDKNMEGKTWDSLSRDLKHM